MHWGSTCYQVCKTWSDHDLFLLATNQCPQLESGSTWCAIPQDAVPKAIMHFLVNHVQRGLQQQLIARLYREELFETLTKEREDVAAKRNACAEVGGAAGAITS